MSFDEIKSPIPCPENWQLYYLKDICKKIGSGATPTGGQAAYLEKRTNYALVRSQNVFDREFSNTGLAFISDEQADALKNAKLEKDDILLNITGDGITFGRACLVPERTLPACVNQHVSIIRLNRDIAHPGYVVSYLTHDLIKSYIESFNAGGSRRAITKGHIESFVVPIPPIHIQESIADLLGGIDERIALLRETNITLESIAQALFKSWFVDFDPVHANAGTQAPSLPPEIQALFPDSFEDSTLGRIPKGWSISAVEDFAERVGMGPFGSNIKVETFVDKGVPVISGQHLKQILVEDNKFNFITEEHALRLTKSSVTAGDVIFTHAGSIGQVSLLHRNALYSSYILSQRQFFLRCNLDLMSPEWITHYFRSPVGQHQLLANTSQVGVPSIARPVSYLRSIRLVVPPSSLTKEFSAICDSFNTKTLEIRKQINALTSLRDTLLPRLMSGQLRLPEVEEHIQEIA